MRRSVRSETESTYPASGLFYWEKQHLIWAAGFFFPCSIISLFEIFMFVHEVSSWFYHVLPTCSSWSWLDHGICLSPTALLQSKGVYPSFGAIMALPLSLLQVKSCCWEHVQAMLRESSNAVLVFVGNSCCLAVDPWLKPGPQAWPFYIDYLTAFGWAEQEHVGKVGTLTHSHGTGHVMAPSQKTCFHHFRHASPWWTIVFGRTPVCLCTWGYSSRGFAVMLSLPDGNLCNSKELRPFFPKIFDMSLSKPSLHH